MYDRYLQEHTNTNKKIQGLLFDFLLCLLTKNTASKILHRLSGQNEL